MNKLGYSFQVFVILCGENEEFVKISDGSVM